MGLLRTYVPAKSCTGSATPGAKALMAWTLGAYARNPHPARNLGIYNCRPIRGSTSTTSLHGEGRAGDVGHDAAAAWVDWYADQLRERSAELGVQLVISRRRYWSAARADEGELAYKGVNPHDDHVHWELSWESARTLTVERIEAVMAGAIGVPPAVAGPGVLRVGSAGPAVAALQRTLNRWYPALPPLATDGKYGPATAERVKVLQRRAGLTVDGVAGPRTLAVLGL